jgi:hypothetical protein
MAPSASLSASVSNSWYSLHVLLYRAVVKAMSRSLTLCRSPQSRPCVAAAAASSCCLQVRLYDSSRKGEGEEGHEDGDARGVFTSTRLDGGAEGHLMLYRHAENGSQLLWLADNPHCTRVLHPPSWSFCLQEATPSCSVWV